ncbi:type VII secretion protein EccCa [Gordonia sp. (in: high G+C Gram-positive bacteria)]|uniref:type VII secretion protein EccCa n=2 Tax=Gordonia sp. (in: high G+C Gram-positive bacteria) TaxID=84139 RepID=UPI003C71E957
MDPLPKEALVIPAPPVLESSSGAQEGAAMRLIMPLVSGGGMMLMMMSSGNVIRMIAGAGFVVVGLMMGISMFIRSKTGPRKRMEEARKSFLTFLERVGLEIDEEAQLQERTQRHFHPQPSDLPIIIDNPARLYERRPADPDFAVVRVGSGAGPLARVARFDKPSDPAAQIDEVAGAYVGRLKTRVERIPGLPVTIPLRGTVSVVAGKAAGRALVRAALTQYITWHAPEDAVIHICAGTDRDAHQWLLHAPHIQDSTGFDGPVYRRRFTSDQARLSAMLNAQIAARSAEVMKRGRAPSATPHIVIVVDLDDCGGQQPLALMPPGISPAQIGVCVLTLTTNRLNEPSEITTRVTVTDDFLVDVVDPHADDASPHGVLQNAAARQKLFINGASRGALDGVSENFARTIARQLSPIRLAPETMAEAPLESTVTIEDLLGIEDIGTFDPHQLWAKRSIDDFLRVPFGIDTAGARVHLDLKESALGGHGPHGLCIGATGSGKSEVLRTMVLALALFHPPERLAFVLVDYKGGAAFAGLDILPHTAAMVDNLGDQEGLVDRLHDAVSGEMQRRQRVLQDAGAKNIYDYNDRRDAGADLEPLPNLAVIIDEFGEILEQKREFLDLFVQIGRIGRSIGVHLLLASQRLEEGRLRGLESHLSYRLGLRTFSALESKVVIGTADAHELPALPGSGYLKVDPDVYSRFKAAYVSGRYEPSTERVSVDLPPIPMPYWIQNYTEDWLDRQKSNYAEFAKAQAAASRAETPFDKIALEVAAERMSDAGTKVVQLWLPPLSSRLKVDEEDLGSMHDVEHRGIQLADESLYGALRFPIGIVDDPARQWQGLMYLEAASANAMIIGAPQTGKTTTARAIVLGSALTHTPKEVSWHVVDAASTTLGDLEELPHVGGVATRFDPNKIARAVAEAVQELSRREEIFGRYRIGSMNQLREMVRDGTIPEIAAADHFLLIDGWASFAADFDALVPAVTDIAVRGLGYGLHVIVTANRLADMRMALQSNLATTIEHRLNNPVDSNLDRQLQQRISQKMQGRVVTPDKKLAQIFDATGAQFSELAQLIRSHWAGPKAPPIRMLPDYISHKDLVAMDSGTPPVLLGLDEATLSPLGIDIFGEDPHLIIFGDTEAGKTNLLKAALGEIVRRRDVLSNDLVVVDPRRSLLDFVPAPPQRRYVTTQEHASEVFVALDKHLRARLPGPDVTPAQLRERSWWKGPEMVVVIDDYDVIVPSGTALNPFAPLVPLLPHARDIGLHIIVARKSSGAARAIFDSFISGLRDNGAAAVLLSGDRAEGQIYTKVYFQDEPAGRGRVIRRGTNPVRVQFAAWPADESSRPVE